MLLRIILFIAIASSFAFGQSDSLQIDGPREVTLGTLVRLSANTTENETPFWIVLRPTDLDYEQVDDGKRLLFSSGRKPTSITVLLLAQQVVDDRITTRQIRRTILVSDDESEEGDPASQPPISSPPNTEPPAVDPVSDSPLFQSVLTAWPNIGTDAAKALSPVIAENFDLIAERCESNQYTDIPSIWKDLSSRNRDALQIESVAWEPIAIAVQADFQDLSLDDIPSHAIHLRAVATAIRQAFQSQPTQSLERSPLQ